MTVSVKPETITVASLFLIGAVYVLPFTVTVTLPVASFNPITITLASSPTVIGFAVASIVKFSLGGIGFSLTVTIIVLLSAAA